MWIGGGGEQLTLRVVARLADWANFGGKPEEWAAKRAVLKEHCKAVGRDEEEIGKSWSPDLLIRETEAEIREVVAAGRAGSIWGEEFDSWAAGNLVGTLDQVTEKIARYVELGCTYFDPLVQRLSRSDQLRPPGRTGHARVPVSPAAAAARPPAAGRSAAVRREAASSGGAGCPGGGWPGGGSGGSGVAGRLPPIR